MLRTHRCPIELVLCALVCLCTRVNEPRVRAFLCRSCVGVFFCVCEDSTHVIRVDTRVPSEKDSVSSNEHVCVRALNSRARVYS